MAKKKSETRPPGQAPEAGLLPEGYESFLSELKERIRSRPAPGVRGRQPGTHRALLADRERASSSARRSTVGARPCSIVSATTCRGPFQD